MSDFERIAFNTVDGVVLRGNFFRADGDGVGIVVMASGLTLLKEHYIDDFARHFRANGFSALAFDPRSYGSSDGEPRHETNLYQQADDYHDAVTAAMTLPGVDPARVAMWGVGHSGAVTMIAAGDDPRLKAVVLQAPNHSGAVDAANFPPGLMERVWQDRERRSRTGDTTPTYVKVWADTPEDLRGEGEPTFLRGEAAFGLVTGAVERSSAAGTPWQNRMTLQSFHQVARTEAQDHVHKIRHPTLYVVTEGDPFAGPVARHRAVAERFGRPAEFRLLTPPDGFGGWAREAMAAHLDFLRRVV